MKKYLSFCLLFMMTTQSTLLGMQAKKERAREALAKHAQITAHVDENLKRVDEFAASASRSRHKFAEECGARFKSDPIPMAPVKPEDDLDGEETEEFVVSHQESEPSSSWFGDTLTWAMCTVGVLVVTAGLTDFGIRAFKKK